MTATADLARTPLYEWHASNGGRIVDFAGWAMPVQYGSIVEEHQATRTAAGLFDVSHMGRLEFSGAGAAEFLDSVVTRRVANMAAGQIRYGLVCNESGGVLDDVLVYRLLSADEAKGDLPGFMMVVNASNRPKIVNHLQTLASGRHVMMTDITTSTAMIAVQGPQALGAVQTLSDRELAALRYYTGGEAEIAGRAAYVSRTGYTGEDGCEIICPALDAAHVWQAVLDATRPSGGLPCGLAARDTLRLEAGMPLYGHELTEQINPIQAGLKFAVNLKDRQFIGRDAIAETANAGDQPVRVGLELEGRRAAREGATLFEGDAEVGAVTSGGFSPTFERPIAMAFVKPSASATGKELTVDVRGARLPATVVDLPFYKRAT